MFGFDIDTIKLHFGWDELLDFDFERLSQILDDVIQVKKGYYKGWNEGQYKNFRITFSKNKGITITGSISNYFVGYVKVLEYKDLERAIERLGRELQLNLHSAKIYRIDLALNIKPNHPVHQYTHHLFTRLSKFERIEKADGLTFQTKTSRKNKIPTKAFVFYNKTEQLYVKKHITTSDCLRFEFRLFRNVSQALEVKDIRVKDLYNNQTFLKLLDSFYDLYSKIEKQIVLLNPELEDEFITPKMFLNILAGKGLEYLGGEKEAYRVIDQLNTQGRFKNPTDKSRCIGLIKKLLNNNSYSKIHPLAEEIYLKIEAEYKKLKNSLLQKQS